MIILGEQHLKKNNNLFYIIIHSTFFQYDGI